MARSGSHGNRRRFDTPGQRSGHGIPGLAVASGRAPLVHARGRRGVAAGMGEVCHCHFVSQANGKRAKVIRSYELLSPRSYSSPIVPSRRTVNEEYAAGPGCSTLATGHVWPSSGLTRTVIRTRPVSAGLLNTPAPTLFLPARTAQIRLAWQTGSISAGSGSLFDQVSPPSPL